MNWNPGQDVKLPDEQWPARLERGEKFVKDFHAQWERSLKSYAKPKYDKDRKGFSALLPYRHVETKKANLFFGTPEVQLLAIDPQDQAVPYDAILPLRQKYLNYKLGLKGTKTKRAVHKALVDAMAASGWMVCKIGYENRTVKVEVPPEPVMFGMFQEPAKPQTVDVPIWERCFVSWVSGKKLIIPDDFHDTDFDEAPWLAVKGAMALSAARALGWTIPKDYDGSAKRDEFTYDYGSQQADSGGADPLVEFTEVWYRAALYDKSIVNPDLYRCLIYIKGAEQPAKHVDSPYQAVDEFGRLTPESMVGNPIHVGTLRDLPDSAVVPSDLTVGEQLATEVDTFREQLMRNRIARSPITMIDPQGFPSDEVDKIKNGRKTVFTNGGVLISGQMPIQVAQTGQEPRDNFTAQEMAERDHDLALGFSANQQGSTQKKKTTATESRIVQSNSSARAETDKERVREYYVTLVEKLDAVLTRYATQAELTSVLGQQGAALWEAWKMLPGRYTYHILPDSGVYLDVQQMRAQALDDYNLLRKDPLIDAQKLLKAMAQKLGYPGDMVLEAAPETGPEPMKFSLSVKGEDFVGPQAPIIAELVVQAGYTISPSAIQQTSTAVMLGQATGQLGPDGKPVPPTPIGDPSQAHGGSAPSTTPLNKHQEERTGGVQGVM